MDNETKTEPTPEEQQALLEAELAKLPRNERGELVDANGQPLAEGTYKLANGMHFRLENRQPETAPTAPAITEPEAPAANMQEPQQSTFSLMHNKVVDELREQGILANPDPAHHANGGITDAMSKVIMLKVADSLYHDENTGLQRAGADLVNLVNQRRSEAGLQAVPPEAILSAVNTGIEKAVAEREQDILSGKAPADAIEALPQAPEAQAKSWADRARPAVEAALSGSGRVM